MGLLVDGKWQDKWYDTKSSGGRFERQESQFRNWVTADGSAGPSGRGGFQAESGRYHLYVSYACPWAHRTLIFRSLKGLEDHISVSVVHPLMKENGWTFDTDFDGATGDDLFGSGFLHEVYTRAVPDATTRVTVPVLWDKKTGSIVSNESAEIIRMFNTAFNEVTGNTLDLYPEGLREEIDGWNERIYPALNNGVYRSGFATTQDAYEEAVADVFGCLDGLEAHLSQHRYLAGERITEADWRLWTTLIRFDPVYVGHFKTNIRRLVDYPAVWTYMLELYQWPGVAQTTHMDHIKHHYYASHNTINPTGIVPVGPVIDLTAPHGRERLSAA
ncbi:glutathione S-transferase family protein [Rhodobacteraceae bacterium NNCM2]|nr:glutathione S-transferase family protein [Coraliihabitans acroporae]